MLFQNHIVFVPVLNSKGDILKIALITLLHAIKMNIGAFNLQKGSKYIKKYP